MLIKISVGAFVLVGIFQLIGLFHAKLLPSIDGTQITSPIIVITLGVDHILLGISLWLKQK